MLRQLDQRVDDDLVVTLEWDSEAGHVLLRYEDRSSPDEPAVCYLVEPWNARTAFLHPASVAQIQPHARVARVERPARRAGGGAQPTPRRRLRARARGAERDVLALIWWTAGLLLAFVFVVAR